MRDRLTTRDRLRGWGLDIPPGCLLCASASESRGHLFFNCSYSNEVWTAFFNHPELSPPVLFEDIVSWVQSSTRNKKLKSIVKLIFHAVVYYIWKERNYRLHSSQVKTQQAVVKEIQLLLRAKLAGLDKDGVGRLIQPSAILNPSNSESYLLTWFRWLKF
ncbi:unnamed protein product [Arabis nemorensis]|uniref:Reverse transcriptase zinc-binding domain-containing protein n=1 Tax=Arabis nemorensis TaxID=586526 RepID=A0A565BGD7_9BRAS|nr:unnamed protein product [Arabis nemorensis]